MADDAGPFREDCSAVARRLPATPPPPVGQPPEGPRVPPWPLQDLPREDTFTRSARRSPLRTSDLRNTSADNLILDAHGELLKTSRMQRESGLADFASTFPCGHVQPFGSSAPLCVTSSDLRNTSDANLILDAHGEPPGTSRMQRASGLADHAGPPGCANVLEHSSAHHPSAAGGTKGPPFASLLHDPKPFRPLVGTRRL